MNSCRKANRQTRLFESTHTTRAGGARAFRTSATNMMSMAAQAIPPANASAHAGCRPAEGAFGSEVLPPASASRPTDNAATAVAVVLERRRRSARCCAGACEARKGRRVRRPPGITTRRARLAPPARLAPYRSAAGVATTRRHPGRAASAARSARRAVHAPPNTLRVREAGQELAGGARKVASRPKVTAGQR